MNHSYSTTGEMPTPVTNVGFECLFLSTKTISLHTEEGMVVVVLGVGRVGREKQASQQRCFQRLIISTSFLN